MAVGMSLVLAVAQRRDKKRRAKSNGAKKGR
jgi:hypothetical protein